MAKRNRNRETPGVGGQGSPEDRIDDAVPSAEQTLSDADHASSDRDQVTSDADQASSDTDQASSASDQRASDRDQAAADTARGGKPYPTVAEEAAYLVSREERDEVRHVRRLDREERGVTADHRDADARARDETASRRDETSRLRDALLSVPDSEAQGVLISEIDRLRSAAAAERERAAQDRAQAAVERARLEHELRTAHLDDLTGVLRREPGQLAIAQEIERARRSDGRFLVVFVDVDRLKEVNDRNGHPAGDRVLQTVARLLRTRLRPYDPIFRYGGDEFVCGLGGMDPDELLERFASISADIHAEAGVSISFGMAALADGDTPDALLARADDAMLRVKARHRSEEIPRP